MSEVTEGQLAGILADMAENARLAALTSAELVRECLNLDAADYAVVVEMMTRLDPTWFEEEGE